VLDRRRNAPPSRRGERESARGKPRGRGLPSRVQRSCATRDGSKWRNNEGRRNNGALSTDEETGGEERRQCTKRRARRGTRIRAIARTALVTAMVRDACIAEAAGAWLFLSRKGETGTQRDAMILSYF